MQPTPATRSVPQIFDRARLAARRQAAAAGFSRHDFLRRRVCEDLEERLDDTPRLFASILELGAADGSLSAGLVRKGKAGRAVAADTAPAFLEQAARSGLSACLADEERLPFAASSFDLVLAPLTLHWVNDLPGTLVQIREVLKPDGLFLAALPGAGSLSELREVLTEAETEITGGLSARLSPLPGLRDMAGLLQRAGFRLPVADRDRLTIRYRGPEALLEDLKGMGERAAFARGQGRPLPRPVLKRAMQLYRDRFTQPDGRVTASFEILHLSGWAPGPGQPQPLAPGSARTSLARAVQETSQRRR